MLVYIKNKQEIEGFKKAGKLTAKILSTILNNVHEGIDTFELDQIARRECDSLGVNPVFLGYKGFPAAICASNNRILVHGTPDRSILRTGDILSIDIGTEIDGFIGDSAETVVVGKDSCKIIDTCRQALASAISQAKAGNRLNDIGGAIYKVARKHNFSIPTEYGGHGIGRFALHAEPYVSNFPDRIDEENIKLRPGMILAIEPMMIDATSGETSVLESDKWSVLAKGIAAHCEYTILITEDFPIILTDREKE